jgi:tRNA-uridine 2-sulfurtransferase
METVFVAMSGGIDSSFTAYLLKQKGYKVVGITFQLLSSTIKSTKNPKACCSVETVARVKKFADDLSIPHYVINLRKEFEEHVIEPFLKEYGSGRTPNPCIRCNKYIKFSSFPDRALSVGADKIATGHYAIIDELSGDYSLKKGSDETKDQSYFLYPIKTDLMKRLLFPLGQLTKNSVKKDASSLGWNSRAIKESQDVCFIPENDCREFLSKHLHFKKGPIYHTGGTLMGTHSGIHLYTIGQRRGLNIPYKEPLYVIDIIPGENSLIVGPKDHLKRKKLVAYDLNFPNTDRADLLCGDLRAKVRYRQKEEACTISISGDRLEVDFHNPVYSITPGQSVVIYNGSTVVGGGIIERSE